MIQTYLNGRLLSDMHPLLNNQSKIDYYIKKKSTFSISIWSKYFRSCT